MFKKVNFKVPAYLLLLMNILGFLFMYFNNGSDRRILYVGGGLMGLMVVIYALIIILHMGEKFLILIANMLVTIGVLELCRIDITKFGMTQIVWIALGGAAFFAAYVVYYNIRFWNKLWYLYLGGGCILFLLTLVFGNTVGGARNWLSIGGFTFQPSEITKILYIMFLACYFSGSWHHDLFGRINPKYVTALGTYLFIGFLVLQRDWGTVLVLFILYVMMLYAYEDKPWFMLFNIAMTAVVGLLGYKFMYHIQVRVHSWLNPWADISNTGYQIAQSLFAIASGGYFGAGLGNGSVKYIPEVHSDFIFSAVCEEMGVFGGTAIILLYLLLIYRCFKITYNAKNPYNKAVGLGLTLILAIQMFIIIGGVTKFIPLTGITLPFVSYGGTSIVVSFAMLGIMQAISKQEERAEETEAEIESEGDAL